MYKQLVKPILDILTSISLLILLSPVLVIIIIILAITQKGKVFFIQSRPGLNGAVFKTIKFKTMSDEVDLNGNILSDDLRMTRIGSIIRKSSLDELPQLINIIKGDMSLIGPRPWLVEYLPLYNNYQKRRHEVKPGITGWAQVNGRNLLGWEERFNYDIFYVNNCSLRLDIKIVWLTIKNVVSAKGVSSENNVSMEKFSGN